MTMLLAILLLAVLKLVGLISIGWLMVVALPVLLGLGFVLVMLGIAALMGVTLYAGFFATVFSIEGIRELARRRKRRKRMKRKA